MLLTLLASIPSIAIIAPRDSNFMEVMPGVRSGRDIRESSLILSSTGMDITTAATPGFSGCDEPTLVGVRDIIAAGGHGAGGCRD